MAVFVRGDCHKCKFEITAECVPRSQKMGFPNCYQSIITNADRIRAMTDEELAKFMALNTDCYYCKANDLDRCASLATAPCGDIWLDWLRQEAKDEN